MDADKQSKPERIAAMWAASFAQEIGLPAGNLWEPNICRAIEADLKIMPQSRAWNKWRIKLFGETEPPAVGGD